jgi:3-hydroxyacyl-CoA dehydrogenase
MIFARNTVRATYPAYPAPLKCIDAIEAAATKSFDDGLAYERSLFVELMFTPVSKALRHAFFAERAASKIADVPESTPVRDIRKAAVIGAGTMGSGIALTFLSSRNPGHALGNWRRRVAAWCCADTRSDRGPSQEGRLTVDAATARGALLKPALEYADLADADIIIEAVFEEMTVKHQVFAHFDKVAKPGAILATNTSTLDVDAIADATSRPADVIGTHFFSPANIMKLLEVVRGRETAKDVLATVMKLAKTLRKTAVVSGVCDGFIGNRMVEQYIRQALLHAR